MTTYEKPERIHIAFRDIDLWIPDDQSKIRLAIKLLGGLLEAQVSSQTSEKVQTPGHSIESPPEASCLASTPIQRYIEPPTSVVNGQIIHTAAHGVRDLQIEAKPISTGDQGQVGTQTSTLSENVPERILSVLDKVEFFIPKFTWDKTKEKSYRTIFFFEHEDGKRVMIFYQNSRIFTTKEAVMTIPHPTPYNYEPLRAIQNNKKVALKFYREYLATEAESQDIASPIRKDAKDKGIYDDILLDEGKEEDKIMSEAAREADERRMEKLRKAAEVNASRWNESDMSPRTKELRKNIVLKATMGVGAN